MQKARQRRKNVACSTWHHPCFLSARSGLTPINLSKGEKDVLKKILLAATAAVAFAGPASAASIVVSDINTVEGVAPPTTFAGQLAGEGFPLFTKASASIRCVVSCPIQL